MNFLFPVGYAKSLSLIVYREYAVFGRFYTITHKVLFQSKSHSAENKTVLLGFPNWTKSYEGNFVYSYARQVLFSQKIHMLIAMVSLKIAFLPPVLLEGF